MKRILLSSVLALTFGCTKRPADAPAPDEAAPEAAAAEPAPVEEGGRRKVEITEDAVKRFVAAQKQILELSKTFASESFDRAEDVAKGEGVTAARDIAFVHEHAQKFSDELAAVKQKSGLDEDTWHALENLFDSLFTGRMAWRQAGGDEALTKLEKDLQNQLQSMPIEQRREAEPELMKLVDGMKGLRDGADARERHGDAAVDLALEHGTEIETLREDLFKLAIKRR